jgi:hypothetical protein
MRFRKLRIASSVICGILCLLMTALWIRSYWWYDSVERNWTRGGYSIASRNGRLSFSKHSLPSGQDFRWRIGYCPEVASADWYVTRSGFLWVRSGAWFRLSLPYWSMALPLASLAVVPWIKWSRRFSIRTLLIVTTLVAVLLSLVVYATR